MRRVLIWSLASAACIIFCSVAPEAIALPANDNCNSPTVIPAAGPFPVTITQDTATATTESSDPNISCGHESNPPQQANSVWFRFTPSSNGTVSVDTIASDYDTALAIFKGVCGSLTEVACNDNFQVAPTVVSLQSSLSNVPVTACVPILIEVTHPPGEGDAGTLVLHFTTTATPGTTCTPTTQVIPTVGHWGMAILGLAFLGAIARLLRARRSLR